MRQPNRRSALHLPTQVHPIQRDPVGAPARTRTAGVAAAAATPLPLLTSSQVSQLPASTACDHLTGPARQMCFALHYGASV